MIASVPKETIPGERRVALVPELVPKLTAAGLEVNVQFGAGVEAGFGDKDYEQKGAHLARADPQTSLLLCCRHSWLFSSSSI